MFSQLADIDIKVLRIFCTIVEAGGFAPAQVKLNITQSMISKQISHLETRLEMRLCNRGRRGFSLTENGKIVYKSALKLFNAIEDFRTEVSAQSEQLSGEIRIGINDNCATNTRNNIPQAIAKLSSQANRVTFNFRSGSSSDMESWLIEGSIHLAIGYFYHRLPSIEYHPLFPETATLYCGSAHALFSEKSEGNMEEIIRKSKFASSPTMKGDIKDFGIKLNQPLFSEDVDALIMLILSGEFIGFIPDHIGKNLVRTGQLRAIFPDRSQQSINFSLATLRGKELPQSTRFFIDLLYSTSSKS